ncbi:MAG: hypothetical protein A2945_03050 [Candidatus Liptonbacteria bacterium RIFCSPLOWO2_01_FULL_52_25]|uniref:Peptidase S8/S53 domain-containing protein n=1 Tax=Candidatus Liptonbacteria bacterium RIFCSPLOWO2_01_FULL_52_25 TaxID=1798650 RepID=A0A1G2CDX8_9BACT|nr:MAG: hypothetical protein A2945_03050 [Candidatus Liptonbacteria bacterium RIFCSPLOWO2_01_FULL_52_25]
MPSTTKEKISIPRLYFLFTTGFVIADLTFLFLDSFYDSYSGHQSFGLLVLLSIVIGGILFIIYRNSEERKWITRAFILGIVWFFTAGGVLAQVILFTEDSRNLEQADTFSFKAYSTTKIDNTWDLLNNLNPAPTFNAVKVGIIDSGVDLLNGRHPEFQGVDLVGLTTSVFRDGDDEGHGTQVAGIIGANNNSFPNPNQYEFPQMNGVVSGIHDLDYTLELAKKPLIALPFFGLSEDVEVLRSRGIEIINMSFGGAIPVGSRILEALLPGFSRIFENNSSTLFVVPAGQTELFGLVSGVDAELAIPGNFGDNFDNVITVGATDITPSLEDTRISFSNFGDAVNISAPGVAVYSPAPRGQGNFPSSILNYDQFFSGTSASAPLVTGVAAILKSVWPTSTPAQIKNILTSTADPLFAPMGSDEAGKSLGSGCSGTPPPGQVLRGCRLNALRAVQSLFGPPPLAWTTCASGEGRCGEPPEASIEGNTITMGELNDTESGFQNSSVHGAAALLPPASAYAVTVRYNLCTWDSYNPDGTPSPGGTGFWDSFSVSVSQDAPYWQKPTADPVTDAMLGLPGALGFGPVGGLGFGDGIREGAGAGGGPGSCQAAGGTPVTETLVMPGNPSHNNYLNVVLDTATLPFSNHAYPSWGVVDIMSLVPTP